MVEVRNKLVSSNSYSRRSRRKLPKTVIDTSWPSSAAPDCCSVGPAQQAQARRPSPKANTREAETCAVPGCSLDAGAERPCEKSWRQRAVVGPGCFPSANGAFSCAIMYAQLDCTWGRPPLLAVFFLQISKFDAYMLALPFATAL